MKITVPDYYKEFKCIAGACEDTCCAGWQVDVDEDSFAYYKTIKGPFGERLRSVMVEGKNGCEGQFRICENGRCPFLNDNNLCDLYAELGEDALCVTCDQYPRYTTEFGNTKEVGIALSCKTAAELILRDDRTPGFEESEDDESFSKLNNIDGELYLALVKARKKAFEIVWDRSISIPQRMSVLLDYAEGLQKLMKKPSKIGEYIKSFAPKANNKVHLSPDKEVKRYYSIWKCYMKQVIIKKEWPQLLKSLYENVYLKDYESVSKAFDKAYEAQGYEYENLLNYFVFRYFLKAVFDRDILTKVKLAVISVLIIRQCDIGRWTVNGGKLTYEEQVDICHLYSRELEHSEENLAGMCKMFAKKSIFKVEKIKELI